MPGRPANFITRARSAAVAAHIRRTRGWALRRGSTRPGRACLARFDATPESAYMCRAKGSAWCMLLEHLVENVRQGVVPIHRGRLAVHRGRGGASRCCSACCSRRCSGSVLLVTAWMAYFFRDPPRVTPQGDDSGGQPGRRRGPGDRARAGRRPSWRSATAPRTCISVFLNIFDVHVNRAPVGGRITRLAYHPGKFLNAAQDKASEDNERQSLRIETTPGRRLRLRADRRADRAAHRVRGERGRGRGRRPAGRADPLRQPLRRLSAGRLRAARRRRPARDRGRDRVRRRPAQSARPRLET